MLHLQDKMDEIQQLLQPEKRDTGLLPICEAFGLKNLAYFGLPRFGSLQSPPRLEVTYKDEWIDHYKEKNYAACDPVLQEGMKTKRLFDWANLDRRTAINKAFFDDAREFDVGENGLTVPIMGQGNPIALVSFTSDEVDGAWQKFVAENEQNLHLVSLSLHEHIWEVEQTEASSDGLTARETECLKWAAIGKTAFESSVIIGISERTVRHHLEMSRKKLDAANITHAVVKAINANLLGLNF